MPYPPLSRSGHVVVIASLYPPCERAGSILVMHELLSCFDPTSFSVITATPSGSRRSAPAHGHRVFRVMHNTHVSQRLNALWRRIQMPIAVHLATRLARRLHPSVIVGVYPELEFLSIAQKVAARERIPWIAYLLDTVALCDSKTPVGLRHRQVRADVFREASQICVLSQGMADHYRTKHGVETSIVTHICSQLLMSPYSDCVEYRAFMGGSIYGINSHAVSRVSSALADLGAQLVITPRGTERQFASLGIHGSHITRTYYPTPQDYQAALSQSGFLLLALDWPDETEMGEDTMQTIFPTRTMEYLASGRPILVHCPEHYFLARFFQKHQCGIVVSDRSPISLREACSRLLSNSSDANQLVPRAQIISQLFSPSAVAGKFAANIAEVEKLHWRQNLRNIN